MKAIGSEKGKCSKVTSQGTPVTTCLRPPVLEPTRPVRATDAERRGRSWPRVKGLSCGPERGRHLGRLSVTFHPHSVSSTLLFLKPANLILDSFLNLDGAAQRRVLQTGHADHTLWPWRPRLPP